MPVEGAMYAFVRVHLPDAYIAKAKNCGKAPDSMYCMDMLEKTGVVTRICFQCFNLPLLPFPPSPLPILDPLNPHNVLIHLSTNAIHPL